MYDKLVKDLRENHDKYFARDMQAADAIENLEKQLHAEEEVCDGYYYAYQHWMHQYIKDIENRVDAKPVDGDKFVDAIIKSYEQSRWIPVTERLPEEYNDVLCYYEYFRYGDFNCMFRTIDRGYYGDGRWGGEAGQGHRNKVLAWMPLPEPPKEEIE